MTRLLGAAVAVLMTVPAPLAAQGYRVRIDARAQAVSYRGLVADSILRSQAVPGPGGGFATPDGYALQCRTEVWCFYFRTGPELNQVPVNATANAVLWGLGIQGLTVHITGRLTGDISDRPDYPATVPNAQLIEGYAEYARDFYTIRGGRLLLTSRLEPVGFDGAWGRVRWDRTSLEFAAYGGFGLGQAAALPVTSPFLTPLDDFRPAERQLVAGAEAAWRPGPVELRGEYRREVDPERDYFVSERTGLSASARPFAWLLATGGFEYNLAEGHWGSADGSVTYLHSRFSVTAGGRRYRPFFSLWTLWGAYSPVPWNGINASGRVQATDWLSLRVRGERYWYEAAEVNTALVPDLESDGWRFGWGATALLGSRWTIDGGYSSDFGPGAASRSLDAAVTYSPSERLSLSAYGGRFERPLELRYYDAELAYAGARGDVRVNAAWRVWADAGWYEDQRLRPDAAGSTWDQLRLRGGITLTFGTDTDRMPLPPARRTP
jgi:hypothetical protein